MFFTLLRLVLALCIALVCLAVLTIWKQEKIIFPGWIPDDTGANKGPGAKAHRPNDIKYTFLTTPAGSQVETWSMEANCSDTNRKNIPIVFLFGGNGSRIESSYASMRFFKELCFDSITVEYSGYGRSTGKPSEKIIYQDVDTLLKYAQKTIPDFEARPKVIQGNSLGGGPATYLAQKIAPDALILLSTFSSLPEAAADKSFFYSLLTPFIRHTFPNQDRLKTLSNTCIILAHGTADRVVPIINLERLIKSIPESNKTSVYRKDGVGHDILHAVLNDLRTSLMACPTLQKNLK